MFSSIGTRRLQGAFPEEGYPKSGPNGQTDSSSKVCEFRLRQRFVNFPFIKRPGRCQYKYLRDEWVAGLKLDRKPIDYPFKTAKLYYNKHDSASLMTFTICLAAGEKDEGENEGEEDEQTVPGTDNVSRPRPLTQQGYS